MLDAKSLEVLQSLKSDITASKKVYTGKVKGTGRSFGFVVSNEGDEHFLPPDQMAKVFPGDEVTFTVSEQDDGKTRAELESLVASALNEFTGVYSVRGKAQGVNPFNNSFSSWLFVPPKQTQDAKNNDIVVATVTRHPWKTGKAQAEISKILGSADNNRSWYSMTLLEHGITEQFTEVELTEAQNIANNKPSFEHYSDRTNDPFITIDAETTKDMDDAIWAQKREDGWCLSVAIADASAFIEQNSLLDTAARQRLSTTYLPGLTLPMVPSVLADGVMSLVENEVRPALVFDLDINHEGEVTHFQASQALIKSQGKLSYAEVTDWLLGTSPLPEQYKHIEELQAATSALSKWRTTHTMPSLDRADFRVRVDEDFNVTSIDKETRNAARDIVEEAMVATNANIAKWLISDSALFMTHAGFKPDRESELKGLLRDYAEQVSDLDGYNLSEFIKIMQAAAENKDFPLATVLQKRFERGQWSEKAMPHFGLGFNQYTNATSPIRKYTDLVNHRVIKAKLNDHPAKFDESVIGELNERGNLARIVGNAVENRLRYQWLAKQPEQQWSATIVHLNANGLIAQLNDNGATGFIDLRKKKDDFSYDPLRMILKFEDFQYQLGESLQVKISRIDDDNMMLVLN